MLAGCEAAAGSLDGCAVGHLAQVPPLNAGIAHAAEDAAGANKAGAHGALAISNFRSGIQHDAAFSVSPARRAIHRGL